MKLNALDWVVIAATVVVLICLAARAFGDVSPTIPPAE